MTFRVLLALALGATSAAAQQAGAPSADSAHSPAPARDMTRANKLLGTVMSPFCPGLTLANCPSVNAETLRVSVRARLEAGESPDSIVESLVAAFGEGVRGAPRARGLGLLLWVLPGAALGVGGLGVAWWLRRRTARLPLPPAPEAGLTPAEAARLASALRQVE
jgi:cytochrome c-type biogenesis protein CcmH